MSGLVRRNAVYDAALRLPGVRSVSWWEGSPCEDTGARGVMVSMNHAWWTWRRLRDRNRSHVITMLVDMYDDSWQYVEVL